MCYLFSLATEYWGNHRVYKITGNTPQSPRPEPGHGVNYRLKPYLTHDHGHDSLSILCFFFNYLVITIHVYYITLTIKSNPPINTLSPQNKEIIKKWYESHNLQKYQLNRV